MPIYYRKQDYRVLDGAELARWREIPAAVASDCLNRAQMTGAAINPIAPGMRIVAQALTVRCMVGDNGPMHRAVTLARPGEALVAAAGGASDTAIWGGLLTEAAMAAGVAGVVIDGTVRDAAEIREAGFACFAAAINPGGPHKGHGGMIGGAIACAGCPVSTGDLILGDDDGVTVVPLGRIGEILAASQAKLVAEAASLERLKAGETLADQVGAEDVTPV